MWLTTNIARHFEKPSFYSLVCLLASDLQIATRIMPTIGTHVLKYQDVSAVLYFKRLSPAFT